MVRVGLVAWGGIFCLMLSRSDHGEGSVESVNRSSLTSKVVSPGKNVLLQQGDFVIGSLELPLGQEEVGPHFHSDLVYSFEDIDDLPTIGGQAAGVGGEGQSSPCLESGT